MDNTSRWRARVVDGLSTRLWPLPALGVLLGTIAGVLLPTVDSGQLSGWPRTLIFEGDASAARSVLSAIASSLVSAATLTFSLTVVAFQLASSQASPRLLRQFSQDRAVQLTLAIFLGTFAFALTLLRSVHGDVVPRFSVTVACLMTLICVVVLVMFLGHVASLLRLETMMRDVHETTNRTIDVVCSQAKDADPREVPHPQDGQFVAVVEAEDSGFVTEMRRSALIERAKELGVVFRELHPVGDSVIAGTPLLQWWSTQPHTPADPDRAARVAEAGRAAVVLGYERTSVADVGFGLRQLVDVCIRALSPGVNDPTTAVHALSHITAVLGSLVVLPEQPAVLADEDGRPRLVVRVHDIRDLLRLGFEPPRHSGSGDPQVAERLLTACWELAWIAQDTQHLPAIQEETRRTLDAVRAQQPGPERSREYDELAGRVFALAEAAGGPPAPRG